MEISRKSGKRTIEWINTKKSSKQEVYDFYERFRNQLKGRGVSILPPKLDVKAKKSEIVNELAMYEQWNNSLIEYSPANIMAKNKNLKKYVLSPNHSVMNKERRINAFENFVDKAVDSGKYDLSGVLAGIGRKNIEDTYEQTQPTGRTHRKGSWAHDVITQAIDDGILPSGLEGWDSQDAFDYIIMMDYTPDDYLDIYNEFFNENNYSIDNPEYYEDVTDFINAIQEYTYEHPLHDGRMDTHYRNNLVEWLKNKRNKV